MEQPLIKNLLNSPIKSIQIDGLFGHKNYFLDLTNGLLILVGENGNGKTTVLNIIYCVLSGNLKRLREYPFERVTIQFVKGERRFSFSKQECSSSLMSTFAPYFDFAINNSKKISSSQSFEKKFREHKGHRLVKTRNSVGVKYHIHYTESDHLNCSDWENDGLDKDDNEIVDDTRNYGPLSMMYLPTYRRIERSAHSDRYVPTWAQDENKKGNGLVRYGMSDIKELIDTQKKIIRDSSLDSSNKLSSEMLNILATATSAAPYKFVRKDVQLAEVIIDRLGEVPGYSKDKIIKLIESGDINIHTHRYLSIMLNKLFTAYEKVRINDELLKNFAAVCSSYLVDKEVVYDQSRVDLFVKSKETNLSIDLEDLSSGEKQLVSLFSRLYLEYYEDKPLVLVIDEPELSLSIDWQKKLLIDIIGSKKCALLITATHSPFIFKNELADYATALEMCKVGA